MKESENANGFDYISYWSERYRNGGNSGTGSYGELANFKAEIINSYIQNYNLITTIEFGCGDGNQLSLIKYNEYVGLDIAGSAIEICLRNFSQHKNKHFFYYEPGNRPLHLGKADLVVCLDVLYHIIDEEDFSKTLDDIFACAQKFVVIYTILEEPKCNTEIHIRYRNILDYLEKYNDFEVHNIIKQKHPDLSLADFLILKRKSETEKVYESRFFRLSDKMNYTQIFDLPKDWWSRYYEYEWAKQFCSSNDIVLDAACGVCHPFKFMLNDRCKKVYACDLDERILSKTEIMIEIEETFGEKKSKLLKEEDIKNINFSKASLINLPYKDDYFDKVFCISVLEHLEDDMNLFLKNELYFDLNTNVRKVDIYEALSEFKRVVKDEGLLVLTFDFPRISLEYLLMIIDELNLSFVGNFDLTLPPDAVYSEEFDLFCFRAVLKKNKSLERKK